MTSRHLLAIDTDGGVDDALALLLALQCQDEVSLELVTTVAGNVPMVQALSNVSRVVEYWRETTGREVSPAFRIVSGASAPLEVPLKTAQHVHGEDGLGGSSSQYPLWSPEETEQRIVIGSEDGTDAASALISLVSQNPGQVSIVALGPLTNLAKMTRHKDAEMLKHARSIVIMGGAFEFYGNVTESAEYNIFADPHAADELCIWATKNNVQLTFVPLDATEKIWYSESFLKSFEKNPFCQFALKVLGALFAFKERIGNDRGIHMHDPLAVAVAIRPDLVTSSVETSVSVETVGRYTLGQTVGDVSRTKRFAHLNKSPNSIVVMESSAEGFHDIFDLRVLAFARQA